MYDVPRTKVNSVPNIEIILSVKANRQMLARDFAMSLPLSSAVSLPGCLSDPADCWLQRCRPGRCEICPAVVGSSSWPPPCGPSSSPWTRWCCTTCGPGVYPRRAPVASSPCLPRTHTCQWWKIILKCYIDLAFSWSAITNSFKHTEIIHLSIISAGPWSIPMMSLSCATASRNTSSQNCIWSQRRLRSFPRS